MKRLIAALVSLLMLCSLSAQEKTPVLCMGNSFTRVGEAHRKLEAIAESESHPLNLKASITDGYTFYRHLTDPKMIRNVETFHYPYRFVFLQNQSQMSALYCGNPKQHRMVLEDAKALVSRIRQYSPDAVIYIEQTWAYERHNCGECGSVEEFDRLLRLGTAKIAKATKTQVSPIGEAFRIVREEGNRVNVYDEDRKHQNEYGSYLKACVNYLLMFREKFSDRVSDCGLDPEQCRYLRDVAERVVLK